MKFSTFGVNDTKAHEGGRNNDLVDLMALASKLQLAQFLRFISRPTFPKFKSFWFANYLTAAAL